MLYSTKLIAEFQHEFNKFIAISALNKYKLPVPTDIPDIYFIVKNSFIKLLFSEEWIYNTYFYLFMENTSRISWPSPIRTRLCIYPYSSQFFELTSDGTSGVNFFMLEPDDLTLLDALLPYRLGETITIQESNSNTFDSNTNTLYSSFSSLTTRLSKLIFLYLKLKVMNVYSDYDNTTIISDSTSTLEMAYETYVIDEMFKFITEKQGITSQ